LLAALPSLTERAVLTSAKTIQKDASGLPRRIIFDGLNLALTQGTGIATYTRTLTRVARALGYDVAVVYSASFTPANDALLREIDFFDDKRTANTRGAKAPRRMLNYAIDQVRCHFPVKPTPIEFSGAVIARQFADTLADLDRAFVARNLFASADVFYSRRGAFVTLAFDPHPDIFHCTYPLPLRAKFARNVYTIHDLVPLRLPFTTLDNKRKAFGLLKKVTAEADHIITVSEACKRDIIQLLGVDPQRITNTYQTVAFPQEYLDRPQAAIANYLDGSFGLEMNGYLLFFGALEPKKNVGRLIEAYLTSGVEIPLILVLSPGWNNESQLRRLEEHEARSAARTNRATIRRLEFVSLSTLVALIRGARAVVFPSLYEGFGLPVLEAMLLGTPVVTSANGGLPEITGDAALLVDPYDVEDITRAIKTITNDGDLCCELSRRGVVQAAKFSLDRYQERVRAVYASLV
jgi:glycosyltransferase involved in cell wall biosynthesis